MDGPRFDVLARSLAAAWTRRRLLAGGLALPVAALAGHAVPVAARLRTKTVRCPYDDDTYTGYDVNGRHAQVFKAPVTGKLSQVKLWISDHSSGPDGDYVVRIVATDEAGTPDESKVLGERVLSDTEVSAGEQAYTFAFSGVKVRKGKRYAIVISRSGGRFHLASRQIIGGDPCPGTVLFTNFDATGGTFHQSNSADTIFTATIKYRDS